MKIKELFTAAIKQDILEAAFISSGPSTGASRGIKFEVRKNAEKSQGELANGQPKEHYDVYLNGAHVGAVSSYSGYQDKKPAGSRIVTSRKNIRQWMVWINGGEHTGHQRIYDRVPEMSALTDTGYKTKNDALQALADMHKSNPNN
jgi:hypothetical protein